MRRRAPPRSALVAADEAGSRSAPSNRSDSTVASSSSTTACNAACIRSCATLFAPRSSRQTPLRNFSGVSPTTMRRCRRWRLSMMPSVTDSFSGFPRQSVTMSPWPNRWVGIGSPRGAVRRRMRSPNIQPSVRACKSNRASPWLANFRLGHSFNRCSTCAISSSNSHLTS